YRIDDGQCLRTQRHLVALLILRPLRWQRPDVAGYFAAPHADDFAAALPGEKHQLDGGPGGTTDDVAGVPERHHLWLGEHAVARRLVGRRLPPTRWRDGDDVLFETPIEELAEMRVRAVRQHRTIHRDVLDKLAHVTASDVVYDAPLPRRQRDLEKHMLGLLPRILPCLAPCMFFEKAIHERV